MINFKDFKNKSTTIKLLAMSFIIFFTFLVFCGTTYAWFSESINNKDNSISSGEWIFDLSFKLNGGINNTENKDYYYSYKDTVLYAPYRLDYNFLGWYNDAQYSGNPIMIIPKNTRGDKVLYAKWEYRGTFGLTFTLNKNQYTVVGTNVTLPNVYIPSFYNNLPVTAIDNSSFRSNSYIENVEISEGIKTLGRNAFRDCNNLKTIILPESLVSISNNAFSNCYNLISLTVKRPYNMGITKGGTSMLSNTSASLKIYVPINSISNYKSANIWRNYSTQIYPII